MRKQTSKINFSLEELNQKIKEQTSIFDKPLVEKENTEIVLDDLKRKGIIQIQKTSKLDKNPKHPNYIKYTKIFHEFTKTNLCDNFIISIIYYVSSTMMLRYCHMSDEEEEYQVQVNEESKEILSHLYCQLLLSPITSNLKAIEERTFYETLILFLEACSYFSLQSDQAEEIYSIVSEVFRGDLKDPHSSPTPEFIPINEIVRRNWLSQKVPGKIRITNQVETLKRTTKLVAPLCEKELRSDNESFRLVWNENGFPSDTVIPLNSKVLAQNELYKQSQHSDSASLSQATSNNSSSR